MKYCTLVLLSLLSTNLTFGQIEDVVYSKVIPEYVLAAWKNDGGANDPKFNIDELEHYKEVYNEFSKRQNQIIAKKFLNKPSDNTLVAHYLNIKLKWNSFNGSHVGLKKLKNEKVVANEIKNIPSRYELLTFYYLSIFSDVLNKHKPMNLESLNIDLDDINLINDNEKAIVFLSAMRHLGGQVNSFSTTHFPDNCFRAKEYIENMPKFNGKSFLDFELPDFQDFEVEVDKRYPKTSFKKRYMPDFENAKLNYSKCLEVNKN